MNPKLNLYNDICLETGGKTSMVDKLYCITKDKDAFAVASSLTKYIGDTEAKYEKDIESDMGYFKGHIDIEADRNKIDMQIYGVYDIDELINKKLAVDNEKMAEWKIERTLNDIAIISKDDFDRVNCEVISRNGNEIAVMCNFQIDNPSMIDYSDIVEYAKVIMSDLETLFV